MIGVKGCNGKIAYLSRAEALKARNGMRAKDRDRASELTAYHCNACGTFHLGRRPENNNIGRVKTPIDSMSKLGRYRAMTRGT